MLKLGSLRDRKSVSARFRAIPASILWTILDGAAAAGISAPPKWIARYGKHRNRGKW